MSTAIRVRNISKEYQIGARELGSTTFREVLTRAARAPFERFRRLSGRTTADESFWALRDVSFDVAEGEVVGIIGRNGAGKSTLLKILSQITEPTSGEVELHGRVGSLLEVGTGFHPELSGRENIYLNGAILGMRRAEIARRFDEIVAFAEVEKFLDTPVKRYSSGMYMRLAFAVAAHLEPEILIVDEVLAVGDAEFQNKCLGKMNEVAAAGRTVLFVSHNLFALKRICDRGIWLDHGRPRKLGPIGEIVNEYLLENAHVGARALFDEPRPAQEAAIVAMAVLDTNGRDATTAPFDEGFGIAIDYVLAEPLAKYRLCVDVKTLDGLVVAVTTTEDSGEVEVPSRPGRYTAILSVPGNILGPGEYLLGCCVDQPTVKVIDMHLDALRVAVTGSPLPRSRRWEGLVSLSSTWRIAREPHKEECANGTIQRPAQELV